MRFGTLTRVLGDSSKKLQILLEGWTIPQPDDFLWLTEAGVGDLTTPKIRFIDQTGASFSLGELLNLSDYATRERVIDFAKDFMLLLQESGDPGAFSAICAWTDEILEALREFGREPVAAV